MVINKQSAPQTLQSAHRVVIKIGSALLVDEAGHLRSDWLRSVAADIQTLTNTGKHVFIVSSGAVALGLRAIGLTRRSGRLEDAQAAAAVGQIKLAQAYQDIFADYQLSIAQILLTLDDLEDRPKYLNARNTVETLCEHKIIPIINENDTVATGEIRFGDNDRLAARVAQMVGADLLVLLSDIDGLYTSDPRIEPSAQLLSVIEKITPDIEAYAGPPSSDTPGSGGMITKVMAAKIATSAGCAMVVMNGNNSAPITRLEQAEPCTLFLSDTDPLTQRKQWIRGLMAPKGTLTLDAGAERALKDGASLLPAGVQSVQGSFKRGDLVVCRNASGTAFAQGLIAYDAEDTLKIAGVKTSEASKILGYAGRSALIHRDDLVIL